MNNFLENNVGTILVCVIGYFIGSINFGMIICKLKGVEIKKLGSGNPGATNVSRYLGRKSAFIVAFLDGIKPMITGLVSFMFIAINIKIFSQTSIIIPAFFSLIGHCWPVWYKFKGGKAVSTFIGLMLMANIVLGFAYVLMWWILFFIIKRVSVCSMLSALITALMLWIPIISGNSTFTLNGWEYYYQSYINNTNLNLFNLFYIKHSNYLFADSFVTINIILSISCIILFFRHKSNIKNLLNGTEKEYYESKKEAQKQLKKIKKETKETVNA